MSLEAEHMKYLEEKFGTMDLNDSYTTGLTSFGGKTSIPGVILELTASSFIDRN